MTQVVIEASDFTITNNNSIRTSHDVDYPSYVAGDLLVMVLAVDSDPTLTDPTAGPDSETLFIENTSSSPGDQGPMIGIIGWIGGSTQSTGSLNWTTSESRAGQGVVLKVPAGEFDATTPLGAIGWGGNATNSSDLPTPAWSAGSTDGTAEGQIVVFLTNDSNDAQSGEPAGWSALMNQTESLTMVGSQVTRDAAVTNSESISSVNYTIDSDQSSSLGIIVRAASGTSNTDIPVPLGPVW